MGNFVYHRFILSTTKSAHGSQPVLHFSGLSTQAVVTGLQPFTQYTVVLEACSSGGCTSTPPLSFLTAAAPPQNQPPPTISTLGPHSLQAYWEPPSQPNGRTMKRLINVVNYMIQYCYQQQMNKLLMFMSK